jgi:hypothetical protein
VTLSQEERRWDGKVRLAYSRRLGSDWRELAMFLDIPEHAQLKFPVGHEADGIWGWLAERERLADLPDGLSAIGRKDLESLVSEAAPPATNRQMSTEAADMPRVRRRYLHARGARLVAAIAVVILLPATVVVFAVDPWGWRHSTLPTPEPDAVAGMPSRTAPPSPGPSVLQPSSTATHPPVSGALGAARSPSSSPASAAMPSPSAVAMQLSATAAIMPPAAYSGSCISQHESKFSGSVRTTTGPVTVKYRWIRSDGVNDATHLIRFAGAGVQAQALSYKWSTSTSLTGWVQVEVLEPAYAKSTQATFTVTCTS